jgi:hypothetical protein
MTSLSSRNADFNLSITPRTSACCSSGRFLQCFSRSNIVRRTLTLWSSGHSRGTYTIKSTPLSPSWSMKELIIYELRKHHVHIKSIFDSSKRLHIHYCSDYFDITVTSRSLGKIDLVYTWFFRPRATSGLSDGPVATGCGLFRRTVFHNAEMQWPRRYGISLPAGQDRWWRRSGCRPVATAR